MTSRKAAQMDEQQGDANMMLILGEIRGAQRETSHRLNNMESKIDAVGQQVGVVGALSKTVGKLEAEVETLKSRAAKQDGAGNALGAIAKSPVVGWLGAILVALWAVLSGKTL